MSYWVELRHLMEERDLVPADLALRAGLPAFEVLAYVQGHRNPDARTIAKLAAALGVLPSVLDRRDHAPAMDSES